MEDLAQQINQILSDPNQMQQLQSVMSSLGLGGAGNSSDSPAPAPSPAPAAPDTQMLGMMTKLAPLFTHLNQEDDSTRLLRALRPLLGAERQKKVDEALKILQMMRLFPMLKDSGIFSGLMSGLL